MEKCEFVDTIYFHGYKIDIGIDDYGQSYFFEYTNNSGEPKEIGCGSYNTDYLSEIYNYFTNCELEPGNDYIWFSKIPPVKI